MFRHVIGDETAIADMTANCGMTWGTTVGYSTLLGLSLHQIFRHVEIDSRGWELVSAYLAALILLGGSLVQASSLSLEIALQHICLASTMCLTSLYGSILVYRAFFHRLHRFPGPFAARLSNLYHMIVTKQSKQQYHRHIQKLHIQYGDFVRTGPREISIVRASAIDLIYGPKSTCEKATWYDQNSGNADKVGIENIRNKEKHGIRRRLWDKGLGFRALRGYEDRVKTKVDQLVERLGRVESCDVTKESIFYSFDVMGDIALSKDFNMLHTGIEHPAIQSLHDAMSIAGIVTTLPWLMNMLRVVPGATGRFERFAKWCTEQLDLKRESLVKGRKAGKEHEPRDVMTWLINAMNEGDRAAPPTERAIQEDARTLITAGSDTVAPTLTNTLYLLVTYPTVYARLQSILSETFPGGPESYNYTAAKSLSYIDHIIHESLRLRPAVPMGFLRETCATGLQIDEVYIPGNTIVNVPTYTIHRDGRYFPDPNVFRPERWENTMPHTAAYLPFQRGGFSCSGKHLAMMQLRMLVANVAMRYDLAFAEGEDGKSFWEDEKETLTLWIPELRMKFTERTGRTV